MTKTYINKCITIHPKHQKWIQDNNINLSRFVQTKIEENMEDTK